MRTRILTGAVLTAILVLIFWFSCFVAFLVPLFAALLAVTAVYEFFHCIGVQKDIVVSVPAYLLAAAMPFCTYVAALFDITLTTYVAYCFIAFLVYLFYLYATAILRRGTMSFADVATRFVGVAYIVGSLTAFPLLRDFTPHGVYLYLLVFLGSWITDTFAYFSGRLFGRHPLAPEISPKKTVEGSIGGMLFCMIAFAVFGIVMQFAFHMKVHYIMLVITGLVCSVVSQMGDLITSLIKREHDCKDFGKIFPGHGGVLDRFDSVIAVTPVLLVFSNLGDALRILA